MESSVNNLDRSEPFPIARKESLRISGVLMLHGFIDLLLNHPRLVDPYKLLYSCSRDKSNFKGFETFLASLKSMFSLKT